MKTYPVLIDQGNLINKLIRTPLQGMIFPNSLALLQVDRLQLTAVYCNRRGVYIPHLKGRENTVKTYVKNGYG